MLLPADTKTGKKGLFYTSEHFAKYMNREGYYKVEVVSYDASQLEKGYLTLYIYDLENEVVYQTNLLLKPLGEPDGPLPLEQLIEQLIQQKYEETVNCLHVDFDEFIGVQCQIRVEQEKNYYNIKEVYPIDEELPEYQSLHKQEYTIPESVTNFFRDRN